MAGMTPDQDRRATYLGLRLAMPLLVGLIFTAVISRTFQSCLQPSISAYYYTPVRPVLVAGLCAIGACLILYRGSNGVENSFLNFSGFLAFIVAFEPTEIGADACDVTNRPDDVEIFAATQNNVYALYVVGAVALLVGIILSRTVVKVEETRAAKICTAALSAVLLAGFIVFEVDFKFFSIWGHLSAAVLLFAGIIIVVGYNCVVKWRSWFGRFYGLLAALMVITASVLFTSLDYKVLIVEASLITLFAVYWILQTVEIESS